MSDTRQKSLYIQVTAWDGMPHGFEYRAEIVGLRGYGGDGATPSEAIRACAAAYEANAASLMALDESLREALGA